MWVVVGEKISLSEYTASPLYTALCNAYLELNVVTGCSGCQWMPTVVPWFHCAKPPANSCTRPTDVDHSQNTYWGLHVLLPATI